MGMERAVDCVRRPAEAFPRCRYLDYFWDRNDSLQQTASVNVALSIPVLFYALALCLLYGCHAGHGSFPAFVAFSTGGMEHVSVGEGGEDLLADNF